MAVAEIDDVVELMKMEYAEMPGLRLTFSQAQRLWNVSGDVCVEALAVLTRSGFLVRTPEGAYVCRRPSQI